MSNRELYKAIKDGDQSAFRNYYESTVGWLVVLTGRITGDVEEARNIAQDTFTKLWLQREQIDPAQSLDGFVSRCATNAAINYWKKNNAHQKYRTEQLYTQSDIYHASDEPLIAQQTKMRIEETIDKMPPKRKEAYLLRHNEHLTNKEIALRMGLSTQTVKMHIWHADNMIKEAVEK